MLRLTKNQVIGLYVFIILSVVAGLLVRACDAYDGMEGVTPNQYYMYTIPQTRYILIKDDAVWHTVVRRNFPLQPSYTGKRVLGIAIVDEGETGEQRYTILMPFTPDAFDSFRLFEAVLGHEIMHIIDFRLGRNLFDPDTYEQMERESK